MSSLIPTIKNYFSKNQPVTQAVGAHVPVPLRRQVAGFLFVCGAAFIVRNIIYTLGDFNHIGGDETWYLRLVKRIFTDPSSENYFWLPAWPAFLSLFYEADGIQAMRYATMVIASINCGLIFLIGGQLWDFRSGIAAGVIMCFYPEHVFFSHYIFAEIGLETFVLLFTWIVSLGISSKWETKFFLIAFFLLGLGMLYKHFVVIPFVALIMSLFFWGNRNVIPLLVVVFLLPVFCYSVALKTQKRDPFFWFDIPIKNIREWSYHKPIPFFERENKWKEVSRHFDRVKKKSSADFFSHTVKNAKLLWVPNYYVLGRIKHYKGLEKKHLIQFMIVLAYLGIWAFGILGFLISPKSFFTVFSLNVYLLLTSLSLFWYMVPRFHVPFLFIPVLFSGYTLGHLRHARTLALR